MPTYSPSGSSAASVIQAFAWLIPVAAVLLLCLATPMFRAAVAGALTRAREYFYGPEEIYTESGEASETPPEDGAPSSAPAPRSELDAFDQSFYDEAPPEPQ